MTVAHPTRRFFLAALAALAALSLPAAGRADAPPGQQDGLAVVDEVKVQDTTVILVQQTPKPPWETPAWAYPERGLNFFPDGPGQGKDRWSVGGLWQIAPMFTAGYKRGLGAGFALDVNLQTIVLFNQLNVGAQWAFRGGPFSFGLTAHLGGYFGVLGKALIATTSFDSTGWGVLLLPGAKAGLQVTKDAWITLQAQAYVNLYQGVNLGGLVLSPGSTAYDGFGLSLIVEYSPKKQGVIYYGVSLYNTAPNYPIFFNVEATPSSEAFNTNKITYLGVLAGYEF